MKTNETKISNKEFTKLTDEEVLLVSGGQEPQVIYPNTNSHPIHEWNNSGPVPVWDSSDSVPVCGKHGPIHVTD